MRTAQKATRKIGNAFTVCSHLLLEKQISKQTGERGRKATRQVGMQTSKRAATSKRRKRAITQADRQTGKH